MATLNGPIIHFFFGCKKNQSQNEKAAIIYISLLIICHLLNFRHQEI